MKNCVCKCHTFHLEQCGECLYEHYDIPKEEEEEGTPLITFTDSAIIEKISEYFHRYNDDTLGGKLDSFYYERIFSDIISEKIIIFESSRMIYLNYLFENKRKAKINKLIHQGIIQFYTKNGQGDIIREYESMGKIRWKITTP